MYSLVLMSAMTTAPDAAEFNGFFRDLFDRGGSSCSGCSGAARYNCSGIAYQSPNCCGGGGGLFSGDRVRRIFDRGGCCGGSSARPAGCCGGGVAYSCSGSCSGSMAYSCFGSGVSYTPVMTGGLSCFGGPVPAAPAPLYDYPLTPGRPPAGVPFAIPERAPGQETAGGVRGVGMTVGGGTGARAKVVVRLPADAKLTVDGTQLKLTGGERTFFTPELPAGMEYTYQFAVEYERAGRVLSEARKVAVRAGGSAAVEFDDLTASRLTPRDASLTSAVPADPVASLVNPPAALPTADKTAGVLTSASSGATARTTITVKLPPGATLYVDERRSPPGGTVRRLTTPPLPAGQTFSYRLRVELAQPVPGVGGTTTGMSETVTFQPGDEKSADFTAR